MAIYSGFTHEKWWFSIVMLVYQRVTQRHPHNAQIFTKKKAIQISAICISNPIPQGSAQQVKKS